MSVTWTHDTAACVVPGIGFGILFESMELGKYPSTNDFINNSKVLMALMNTNEIYKKYSNNLFLCFTNLTRRKYKFVSTI
jgi:hypothetical protein